MKKLIAIMAVIAVMASFGACGESNNSSETQTENGSVNVTEDNEADDENEPAADNSPITEDDVRNHAETPASDFEYVDHGDNVSIKAYNGSDPIVVIPEQIDGKDVVGITDGPFTNDSFVKGISLPSTIKELEWTFGNNAALQVVLASGVETVGEGTFVNNTALKVVDLGDNLTSLNESNYFEKGVEKLYIPAGVTELNKYMFLSGTDNLTIVGEAGSYAETYANENGFNFEVG